MGRLKDRAEAPGGPRDESLRLCVEAARRCFARKGVAKTRMEDVAAEAGLSRQYLHRLTGGREGLIELALIDRAREFTDELASRASGLPPGFDVRDALIDQTVFAAKLGRSDPEFLALADGLPRERTNHALTSSDSPFHGYTVRAYKPLFAAAMTEGLLRTDVTVDAMVDWLQGVLALLAGRDDLDDAGLRRLVGEFVLPSLLV